jgi:hypothetical protein
MNRERDNDHLLELGAVNEETNGGRRGVVD